MHRTAVDPVSDEVGTGRGRCPVDADGVANGNRGEAWWRRADDADEKATQRDQADRIHRHDIIRTELHIVGLSAHQVAIRLPTEPADRGIVVLLYRGERSGRRNLKRATGGA